MPVLRTLFTALALLAVPLASVAGQALPAQPEVPDTVRVLYGEIQELQQRLESIQMEAFEQHPALDTQRQEVEQFVTDAMVGADPDVEEQMERLPRLQQELVAAQQAQDTAKLREVVMEGRQIQGELTRIRDATMQQEDVQERVNAFRESLLVAMREVDPATDQVVGRIEEMARKLQELQGGG